MARYGLTRKSNLVSSNEDTLVSKELTNVSWNEGHFRSFLSALPYANGSANRATMRAQIKAIQELMSSEKIQPTHPWVYRGQLNVAHGQQNSTYTPVGIPLSRKPHRKRVNVIETHHTVQQAPRSPAQSVAQQ